MTIMYRRLLSYNCHCLLNLFHLFCHKSSQLYSLEFFLQKIADNPTETDQKKRDNLQDTVMHLNQNGVNFERKKSRN